jgi:flagellar basal body P-ring formation protein FlgA
MLMILASSGAFCAGDAASPPVAAKRVLPVPRVTIYPGNVIGGEMLAERAFSPAAEPKMPVYDSIAALTGMVAQRTLLPGGAIPLNSVRTPYAVTPGKAVAVTFQSGGLTITGSAVVLQSGSAGEIISARNSDSGLIIKATVQSDGSLKVDEQ